MNQRRRRTDGARILVVEDSEDFRALLELTLHDAGYSVDGVASSEDAIGMLAATRYDLVVTDYALPGHSGAWLLSQTTGTYSASGMAALMITGDPDAPGIPDDVAVVPKPVDFDQLLARVRSIIANTSAAGTEPSPEDDADREVQSPSPGRVGSKAMGVGRQEAHDADRRVRTT